MLPQNTFIRILGFQKIKGNRTTIVQKQKIMAFFSLILSTIKGHVCFKLDEVVSFNGLQPFTLEVKFQFGCKLIFLQIC